LPEQAPRPNFNFTPAIASPMKKLILSCGVLLFACPGWSQVKDLYKYGIDTSSYTAKNERYIVQYFSAHVKYPESSMSLANRANEAIKASGKTYPDNGFITFRFGINAAGKPFSYNLYLLDKQYQPAEFSEGLIRTLYTFTSGLQQWPVATYQNEPAIYVYYLSYQIRNGVVVTVAP